MNDRNDDLVTLLTATSEFAANSLVIVLEDAGIPAFAFSPAQNVFGVTGMSGNLLNTAVQVRREDLDRARAALESNRIDSVDIDWDAIDVGEPVEQIRAPRSGLPLMATLGMIVAVLALLSGLVLALAGNLF